MKLLTLRYRLLYFLTGFVFFCVRASYAQDTSNVPPRPNILVILTDDQGYHDVSYYGTSDLRTPHTDRLAAEGMRFDNFYANCPVCSPTRAALLTGRYQEYVGVPGVIRTHADNSWGYLDPQVTLLPQPLREVGYHTALIGKWHLGLESPNTPNERGFDEFHGWLGDMMDDYVTHRRHDINYMRHNQDTIDPAGHATDLFTQWSVDYIKQRAEVSQPFFLYLAYNAPHFPVQPPAEWLAKVERRQPNLSAKRAALVAFVEHLDDGIGQVVQALKESGQYDNTLIVFTSDNGGHLPSEANNGPWRDGKGTVYEGGLRVPTCVAWPAVIKAGTISDQVNLSMDLYPTLLQVAGARPTDGIEGRSFLRALFGERQVEPERPLFFSRREGGAAYGGKTIDAVRLGDWKLLQNSPFGPRELYNLKDDPREENNVIEEYQEVFRKLDALQRAHLQRGGAMPWQKPATANQKE